MSAVRTAAGRSCGRDRARLSVLTVAAFAPHAFLLAVTRRRHGNFGARAAVAATSATAGDDPSSLSTGWRSFRVMLAYFAATHARRHHHLDGGGGRAWDESA